MRMRLLPSLLGVAVLFCPLLLSVDGCGFPTGGGGGVTTCYCGGGGGGGYGGGCGGGCGRRKRDTAVQPHFKGLETPCPQSAWRPILEEAVDGTDAIRSVDAVQTALFRRFASDKFLVLCVAADEAKKANKVHFSSSGNAYCNVLKGSIWCQAIALAE